MDCANIFEHLVASKRTPQVSSGAVKSLMACHWTVSGSGATYWWLQRVSGCIPPHNNYPREGHTNVCMRAPKTSRFSKSEIPIVLFTHRHQSEAMHDVNEAHRGQPLRRRLVIRGVRQPASLFLRLLFRLLFPSFRGARLVSVGRG